MLISQSDGGWEYVRVKNELARGNSIGSVEAKDIAQRSLQIAERLGRPCHIMWFVGCIERDGSSFNIPWYWTEAHKAERNLDRSSYRVITVTDRASLATFEAFEGSRLRQALALRPTDLNLMRDTQFIESVGRAANAAQVPVILSGSTLAHAYYQLRKLDCAVVTPTEKKHARVRRAANLGKLVRDKIPEKIDQRQEMRVTRKIEGNLRKGFLLSKLIEEALEVREASDQSQKIEELADLYEVFRAIAEAEGVALETICQAADQKKGKAGGFEQGLVLLQTAITSGDRAALESDGVGEVLGDQTGEDSAEIPFSFFGFMELDQPRSIQFEQLGIRLDLTLRPDRLELKISRNSEQLEFPIQSESP
jgi:predicted house-cleaning noncanonical NTP pyrophosphatase (MazG superfamily)